MKQILFGAMLLASSAAWAGTITVTSPGAGDFLGKSNTVRFNITGAVVQVRVVVTATLDSNPSISVQVQQTFDPTGEGRVDGSIPLNFSPSTPEGAYTLTVVATEDGATYNTVPPIPINVDVKEPKFGDSNPLANSYVKGVVPIVVDLEEPNVKEWRVRISGADIPNNSGSTNLINVNWDSSTIIFDGPQTINLSVEDLAQNKSNKDISVTVDRINPSSTILAPTAGQNVRPGSRLAVVVDVNDQFNGSVHWTGINVHVESLTGQNLGLVPRRSVNDNGNKITWTGRIRNTSVYPDSFKIIVTAVDRAGNVAVVQEVTVTTSRGRGRSDGHPTSNNHNRGRGRRR